MRTAADSPSVAHLPRIEKQQNLLETGPKMQYSSLEKGAYIVLHLAVLVPSGMLVIGRILMAAFSQKRPWPMSWVSAVYSVVFVALMVATTRLGVAEYRLYRELGRVPYLGPNNYGNDRHCAYAMIVAGIGCCFYGGILGLLFSYEDRLYLLMIVGGLVSIGIASAVRGWRTAALLNSEEKGDTEMLQMGPTYKASRRSLAFFSLSASEVVLISGFNCLLHAHGAVYFTAMGAYFGIQSFLFLIPWVMLLYSE